MGSGASGGAVDGVGAVVDAEGAAEDVAASPEAVRNGGLYPNARNFLLGDGWRRGGGPRWRQGWFGGVWVVKVGGEREKRVRVGLWWQGWRRGGGGLVMEAAAVGVSGYGGRRKGEKRRGRRRGWRRWRSGSWDGGAAAGLGGWERWWFGGGRREVAEGARGFRVNG
nr:uncharacterized protein LOC112778333 [Arachis hypogaea]